MSRRKNAIGIFMTVLALTIVSATACREKPEDGGNSPSQEAADTEDSKEDMEDMEDKKEPDSQEESLPDSQDQPDSENQPEGGGEEGEVPIYSINDDSLESEQTYVPIEEITPESVVQAVVDSLAEHSLEVGIDSVTMEGDTVIVSFLYGKAPLTSVGSTVEETILNSIADSLLDNVEGCKNVIFRAEGEAYESGHYAFGVDEVYAKE